VLPISDAQAPAARALHERLRAAGIRSHLDERNETLNYRIRDGELQKIPYMAVVGSARPRREARPYAPRGAGNKQAVLPTLEFLAKLQEEFAPGAWSR